MGMSRVPSFSNRPGFPSGLRVLVIDEDDGALSLTSSQLRECSYEVLGCTSISEATDAVESADEEFDILLCEACFVSDETFGYFSKRASTLPIVIMGANASKDQKMAGVNSGAVDFLEKPLSSLKLRNVWQHTVRKILKQRASQSQSRSRGDTDASPEPSDADNKTCVKDEPGAAGALRVPDARVGTEAFHNESTGSSAAEASPWSAATAIGSAGLGAGTSAATGGTSAAATRQKCRSSERTELRSARSLRSGGRSMQTRSCNSLDGLPSGKSALAAGRTGGASNGEGSGGGGAAPAVASGSNNAVAAAAAPAAAAPPLPRALTPIPSPSGTAPQYSLQGMPPPLPGCVWGLPMLPPPVPGLMGAPMMMPASGMMGSQSYPQVGPHWCGTGGVPGPVHHSGQLGMVPHAQPAAPQPTVPVAQAQAASTPAKGTGSLCTWSHDAASTETGLVHAPWADLSTLPFESADDVDGALRQFSADLLNDESEDVVGDATADGGDESDLKDIINEKLPGDGLEWMDADFMMDDNLVEHDKGVYLDIMA